MSMNHQTPAPAPTPLCAVFEPQVALLSSGMLDADEAAAVHEHLAGCAYCQLQLHEFQHLREGLLRHLLGVEGAPDAPAGRVAVGGLSDGGADAPIHFTLEDILRADEEEPPVAAPRQAQPPTEMSRHRRLLTSIGAIAAVLLLALFAATLFGALRSPRAPAAQPTATPVIQGPFAPYLAAAPGLPCDHNAQASALWSGDQGECIANPAGTRLVAQGHLLAVMRWDAGAYHLPDRYKVSVQVTLVGAATAKLQVDNVGREVTRVIACSPNHCDVDGQASAACACDTSAPVTLAITVEGRNESFSVGSTVLATMTEPEPPLYDSIALGVSTSDPSAQGAQAIFANYAVVAV